MKLEGIDCFWFALTVFAIGLTLGVMIQRGYMMDKAVALGKAEYVILDPKKGAVEWRWKP